MKKVGIAEVDDGEKVEATFCLCSKEIRVARTGDPYLAMELGDRTGTIPAVLFRPSETAVSVPSGVAVRACGRVTRFRGARQLSVDSLTAAERWDPADLIGSGTRAREELVKEFNMLARQVGHIGLRRLLRSVFDAGYFERFSMCPASERGRRTYLTGLLEHTVAVASICRDAALRYEGIDTDLLLASALLHDVGVVDSLSFDTGVKVTDQGRLLGHAMLGVLKVRDCALQAGIESAVLMRVEHAILSHHGKDDGSNEHPVPMTIEALALRQADVFDAQTVEFASALKGAALLEETWTDSSNAFERPLFAAALQCGQTQSGKQLSSPSSLPVSPLLPLSA
ncbi:MAG: HD domain-containing protein [Coriobacteriia bacterium]|nr:HD domain-containing protein [Coriobacteriia bacterium]